MKHKWTQDELRLVLDSILLSYSSRDWSDLISDIASDVGVSKGSVNALYISLSRISQGFEPNPTKGGVGHNWGLNVEWAFDKWKCSHNLSQSKLNVIFS